MFILIAVTKSEDGQWTVRRLPVLDMRPYTFMDWQKKLGTTLFLHYTQVWLANRSIPVKYTESFDINVKLKSKHQMDKLLRKWSVQYNLRWYSVQSNMFEPKQTFHSEKSEYRVRQAMELWDRSVKGAIEGKLLHLYEFQRSIAFQGVPLSLEQIFEYIFIWCWLGMLEVCCGLKRSSNLLKALVRGRYECRRCMNNHIQKEQTTCYSCGHHCLFCNECVQLGKVSSCSLLLYKPSQQNNSKQVVDKAKKSMPTSIENMMEPYSLSDAQADAVKQILEAIVKHYTVMQNSRKSRRFNTLIWAVTGAGKTEMIYPLIHYFLLMNKRVLIAIPRRDVVQELQPRVSKAFPEQKVIALFGGSKQVWETGDIYIATTHQLVRYSTYFDLVILDEMDAFPYYNNKMLMQTLKRVQKRDACFVQLTATVPQKEKLRLQLLNQHYVKVPVRFHRYPLPVPKFFKIPTLMSILQTKQLPNMLITIVQQSVEREAVLFIFLQRKEYLNPFTQLLRKSFPHLHISFTSAEDEKREYKVQQFRERHIDVLVTTSILERGVTIKKSDICIVDVHQRAFNRTAIVQMAGRAGRSIEDPKGFVYLLGVEKTNEVKQAIKEIVEMNELAKKRGYLRSE